MCATSVVYDQYRPWIPSPPQYPYHTPISPTPPQPFTPVAPPFTNQELRELIESFKQAIEAAKVFDRLTKQPDCEDPEKARLQERVAELERRLDALEEQPEAEQTPAE